MVHLDTNFLIDALVQGTPQEAQLVGWLATGEPIGMSSLAWGEFLCGPLSSSAEAMARRLFTQTISLDRLDAEKAASLYNLTGRRAKSFPDCCIAAVAIRAHAQLATSNRRDFTQMVTHGLLLA